MLYVLMAISIFIATFFVSRHYAIKTRLVEREIDKVIARRLAGSDYVLELSRLREENTVMRNLLLDLVENETDIPASQPKASQAELAKLRDAKMQRYREILAESVHVLRQQVDHRVPASLSLPTSAKSEKS